jgi:hypothetical protein
MHILYMLCVYMCVYLHTPIYTHLRCEYIYIHTYTVYVYTYLHTPVVMQREMQIQKKLKSNLLEHVVVGREAVIVLVTRHIHLFFF